MSGKWTPGQVQQAEQILGDSGKMGEALERIQSQLKRSVTEDALRNVFKRNGLLTPFTYLRVDPLLRRDRQDAESRLKREHAEMVERLREVESRQSFLDRLGAPLKTVSIPRREPISGQREGTAVILASDWHIEEHVPKRADTAENFYDLAEANRRVRRFFTAARWLIETNRSVFGLRDAVLWLGGDLMTGYLRAENLEENELSPVEAVLWLRERLVAGIDFLLDDEKLERLTIPCSHGNHGRTTEKRRIATGAKNSFEWLLYQWLTDHYKGNPRVVFITDQSNHQYLQIYDYNLHFHHGDEVKYQGGIGGIAVPLLKAVAGWNQVKPCHYHHMGHWHQLRDFGNVTVNGSLIGYNAYAMSVRADPEPPQQAFYILDSRRGKTAQFPIWVKEIDHDD